MGVAAVGTLAASVAVAGGAVVGPGDVSTAFALDTNASVAIVDLTAPVVLAPGTYKVATFDTQFEYASTGTLTPYLVSDVAGVYTPIAIGTPYTAFTVDPSFVSKPFGGSDTFTLAATTTVEAAFSFQNDDVYAPISFDNGGSVQAYYVYGQGTTPGPVLGTPLAAAAGNGISEVFSRDYDFSITLAALPEPAAWATMMLGLGLAGAALRGRRAPAAI